jgi:hypothetical protein
MARRSGFDSTLVVGYSAVIISEVTNDFKATQVRISKVVEPTWKVSMARRGGFESALVMGYGMVNILAFAAAIKTTCI